MRRVIGRRAGSTFGALLLFAGLMVGPRGAAAVEQGQQLYFVVLEQPALSSLPAEARTPTAFRLARGAQSGAVAAARRLGGSVRYRYARVLNGFSAELSSGAAASLQDLPEVAFVEPVPVVRRALSRSVELIGAPKTWSKYRTKGRGIEVAVVDTGIDYTHKAFNGPGSVQAYKGNDSTIVEPGTFPTGKVVAGHDFVGDDYDVLDNDPNNDVPMPDDDPLDANGHGTHVAGTCCGKGVAGSHGPGVAPAAKIHAYKVWGGDSSTADVLVAAYELAVDPNRDGDPSDRVDVLNFSGGVYYGTASSAESLAAQGVVDAGTIFVAAAGNSGGNGYRVGTPATAPGVLAVAASDPIDDRVAGFSSVGPSRDDAAVKPEITAPGVGIRAAAAGSGDGATVLEGTSMASPHVAGAAALLSDLHQRWAPAAIKAALMNQATRAVSARGIRPAPAIFMGAGRVRVNQAARARSLLLPGTLSFGVRHATGPMVVEGAPFRVSNRDRRRHRYVLVARHSYSSVANEGVNVAFSRNGSAYARRLEFRLGRGRTAVITPRLIFDPSVWGADDELIAHHRELPVVDGVVVVRQRGGWKDTLKAPWLLVPYAASEVSVADQVLDLSGGQAHLPLEVAAAPGTAASDVYVLGATDPVDPDAVGEEDILVVGARSFTGATLGDGPEGSPPELDASGKPWLHRWGGAVGLVEPVEFFIGTASPHHTVETLSARVFIDAGADGVFADDTLKADYIVEKQSLIGDVCIRDLRPMFAHACTFSYGLDYRYFDTSTLGLVVDATKIGLTQDKTGLAYRVELCTDRFSGDVPQLVCDETAAADPSTTYSANFDVIDPGIDLDNWFCGGFWSTVDCSQGFDVTGGPGAPDLLLVFPNNVPGNETTVVTTP